MTLHTMRLHSMRVDDFKGETEINMWLMKLVCVCHFFLSQWGASHLGTFPCDNVASRWVL